MARRSLLLVATLLWVQSASSQPSTNFPQAGLDAIAAVYREKATRTAAEAKLESRLLHDLKSGRSTVSPSSLASANAPQDEGLVLVTIQAATVSHELLQALTAVGARSVIQYPEGGAVTALVPLNGLLAIASLEDVGFVYPIEAPVSKPRRVAQRKVGAATSEGVKAHRADSVQNTGIKGAGGKVCVISDGIDSWQSRVGTSDLPIVDILPNQAGSGDEGTAMLEIIHDMAPSAALGFATQGSSQLQMAANINGLAAMGCAIMVDDVTFPGELAFQDDDIATAVNNFVSSGGLYFSAAGNDYNKSHGGSGVWEGDFASSGLLFPSPYRPGSGLIYSFGTRVDNTLIEPQSNFISLQWADPKAGSSNDYDLFLMDSTLSTILKRGDNSQNGTQNPIEIINCKTPPYCIASDRLVIVLYQGFPRALRLWNPNGRLDISTYGATAGHNAALGAVTVASVSAVSKNLFVGPPTDAVQEVSSDGPRKLFFNPNGSAITPGNFLFSTNGGVTLFKVDLAAADGVVTTLPQGPFNPFYGTSAAAPHAASIGALAWSASPGASASQIRTALFSTALDIEAPGWDRDSGYGIVMADRAVRKVLSAITVSKTFSPPQVSSGGISTLAITLTNPNVVTLQNIALTDSYPTQVVNATAPNPGVSGTGCAGLLSAVPGGNALTLTNGTVPPNVVCTITVKVTSNTPGIYVDSSGEVKTPIDLNTSGATATLKVVSIAIAPTTLPSGTVAQSYSQSLTADGGAAPYSFVVTFGTLPPGVGLSSTGALNGSATASDNYSFTVTATDSTSANLGGPFTGSQTYSVSISKGSQSITFAALTDRTVNSGTFTIAATATSSLPVTFASDTTAICTVSGTTVTLVRTGTCAIRGGQAGGANWNAALDVVRSFSVTAPTITVDPLSVPGGIVGIPYATQMLSASGGTSPYTFSITSGALPDGILLSSVGQLSGKPTAAGNFNFTAMVTDNSPVAAGGPFSMAVPYAVTVAKADQVITFGALADRVVDSGSFTITATADSGLAVSFVSITTAVCSVSGGVVTMLTPGACAIRATQVGDPNFNAATPVDRSFTVKPIASPQVLDVDGDGEYDALTDGLVVLRYLFGLTGNALVNGAVGSGATRKDAAAILSYLHTVRTKLDVDDNNQTDALGDGLMILRYLFGLRGTALVSGAIGQGSIKDAAQIGTYIQSLMP